MSLSNWPTYVEHGARKKRVPETAKTLEGRSHLEGIFVIARVFLCYLKFFFFDKICYLKFVAE